MKRGIIRIVSGVVLLLFQALALYGQSLTNTRMPADFWYQVGFYSPAIIGFLLLVFGIRAHSNELYSKIVLHKNEKKIHTIIKWVAFAISTLFFVTCLLTLIENLSEIDFTNLFLLFATLALSVYSLFYMYKKPSCLLSTALIFMGVSYIYEILIGGVTYMMLYEEAGFLGAYIFANLAPGLIAGILYIVVAVKLYKEDFSIPVVKVLGWVILALEILSQWVFLIIICQEFFITTLVRLPYLLLVTALAFYISVLKLNSLRDASKPAVEKANPYVKLEESVVAVETAPKEENRCEAVANISRKPFADLAERKVKEPCSEKIDEVQSDVPDKKLFCRMCGAKLLYDSKYCYKCGTEVIIEKSKEIL